MSANDTGWISTAPQGQPGMPPAPQAAPPAQGQPAQKMSQDDTGWLPTTPQKSAPASPASAPAEHHVQSGILRDIADNLHDRDLADSLHDFFATGPEANSTDLPLTSYGAATRQGLNTVVQRTIDVVKGAIQSSNPKPADEAEAEALKTAGIGGMYVYRMIAGLGHPLMDANKVAAAIHDINQSKDPVGTYLKVLQEIAGTGAGQALTAIATEGVVRGVPAAVKGVVKGVGKELPVGMETKVAGDAKIPVRGTTLGARAAGQLVSPEVPEAIAQEKTAPAVKQAVGDILGKATGSKAETILSTETGDSFGVRGHATSLIGEATPVMDRIDELSGNKLTDAQADAKAARAKNDWDGYNAAKAKQQDLFDQYRNQLSDEGLDVDTAVGKYRKAMRLDEIATALERSIDKDTGALSGKKLSNEIGKLVAKGPKKSPLLRGDFTQDHVSALREVADIMKDQESVPTPIIYSTMRAAAALFGLERSGVVGLGENIIGERLLEAGGRKLADRIWADALAEPAATPKLAEGLKNGDIQPAVNELAKDPSWVDRTKGYLRDVVTRLYKGKAGEAGAPGTIFEPHEIADLKKLGMSDADIEGLRGSARPPASVASIEPNASGPGAAKADSLEAIRRLATEKGSKFYDVDSRKAAVKSGYQELPATVDRVDVEPQPFHHKIVVDKDGNVTLAASGKGAKKLPADDHIRQILNQEIPTVTHTYHPTVGLRAVQ